jgi:hypothetical protein
VVVKGGFKVSGRLDQLSLSCCTRNCRQELVGESEQSDGGGTRRESLARGVNVRLVALGNER